MDSDGTKIYWMHVTYRNRNKNESYYLKKKKKDCREYYAYFVTEYYTYFVTACDK